MAPNVSIRESIRWLPEPASEPTSTIVLTSEKRYFVDMRIHKAALIRGRDTEIPLPPEDLDWAFAGKSSSTVEPGGPDGKEITRGSWWHIVDSRHVVARDVVDEAKMMPLDSKRTLETGSMVNPKTGAMTEYEEIWKDEEVIKDYNSKNKMCIVAEVDDPDTDAYGMIIRLGQYCQAVLRIGDSFSAQRWQCGPYPGTSSWHCLAKFGDHPIPCECFMVADVPRPVGDSMYLDGYDWEILEGTQF